MSPSFPTSVISLANPSATTQLNDATTPHAAQHANVNDEVEAIEAHLFGVELAGLRVKSTTDTPDDEFPTSSLDAKWSVVTGNAQSVTLLETGNVQSYDLSTRSGSLLMQVGSQNTNKVEMRQDYTLPDGKSLILCAYFCAASSGDTGINNNQIWAGLALNDNDSHYDSGEWNAAMFDVDKDGWRFIHWAGGPATLGATAIGGTTAVAGPSAAPGARMYLRLHRSGTSIFAFVSTSGRVWMPLGKKVRTATATNVWLFAHAKENTDAEPVPIQSFEWLRLGGAGIEPW